MEHETLTQVYPEILSQSESDNVDTELMTPEQENSDHPNQSEAKEEEQKNTPCFQSQKKSVSFELEPQISYSFGPKTENENNDEE